MTRHDAHTSKTPLQNVPNASGKEPAPIGPAGSILLLLGLISLNAVTAGHIIVLALPAAVIDLGSSPQVMQLTISVYLVGLAIGQLIYGPMADWLGERRILVAGLTLYLIATIAAFFAPTSDLLILCRFGQSMGSGAGLVLSRSIARSGFGPEQATRRLALINLIITLGPALSPLIGGALTNLYGWRSIFLFLALLGSVCLIGTIRIIPHRSHASPNAKTVTKAYLRLMVTPCFLAYAVAGAAFTTPMYALIGAAPFVLTDRFSISPQHVGPMLALATMGIWLGSMMTSKLVKHRSVSFVLMLGAFFSIASAVSFLILMMTDQLTANLFIGILGVFLFAAGVSGPPALSLSLGVNPLALSSGSGLYGAFQMAVGALSSFCISLGEDPAMGAAMVVNCGAFIGICALVIARHYRAGITA